MTVDPEIAFSNGDLMRRIRELEKLVRELAAGRRLENASVGAGGIRVKGSGGVTLQDGGDLVVEDGGGIDVRDGGSLYVWHSTNDVPILRVSRANDGKYYIELRRDDGSLVLETNLHSPTGRQFWALRDGEDNIVVSDSGQYGTGLARPWLPVPLYPRFAPSSPAAGVDGAWSISASAVTSEKTLWEGRATISHPEIQIDGTWGHASGSGNITYRLKVQDNTVGTWVENGGTTAQRGPFDVSSLIQEDWRSIKVTAQAAGGATGEVWCTPWAVYLR